MQLATIRSKEKDLNHLYINLHDVCVRVLPHSFENYESQYLYRNNDFSFITESREMMNTATEEEFCQLSECITQTTSEG